MIVLLLGYGIGTCVLTALVWEMRSEAISSGGKVLTAFLQLTEEQTTRTIQNVDQTLEIAEERIASARRENTLSASGMRVELLLLLKNRPYLKAITVLDRNGIVIYRSDASTTELNLSDRAYFIVHRDHIDAGFQLGAPIRSRATGQWRLPASRVLKDANGVFDGVIVASVDPFFFIRVWSVGKSIADQATALWTRDGVLLIRSPFDERAMGVTFGNGLIASRIRQGSEEGTARTTSGIDGKDRLAAYGRLATYPNFSLSVTQATEELLATWWRTAWLVAMGWAFSGAALVWLAIRLVNQVITTRAADDRYRVLFKESPYPTLVVDPATMRFLAVNDAAVQQYGWSQAEHLKMTIDDHYLPSDVPALMARRKKYGSGNNPVATTTRHRTKNGRIIDVELAVRHIEFEGKPALLAMVQDIGARLSLEEQLRQSQKMDVVGQLTGGIAHDFNNLLMVILGNIDMLLDDDLGPLAAERLGQMGEAVDRAATLTRQLLAFSRKQPLSPQPTDLNGLITDIGKLLRRTLGSQIEIDSVLAEDLCTVNVDRAQLETALVNLCLNARDAMPMGGKVLIESRNVVLDADYAGMNPEVVPGGYALIEVSDDGAGISAEDLKKVFEPFFTTKEVGKGSGLGLSMVYGFIHQSQGHIKIYSEVGRGTSIKLYLPCTVADADRLLIEKVGGIPTGTEQILVVEDEPRVRASVVEQLRSLGYTVFEAEDGEAALSTLERTLPPFDLMLTDIMMPGPLDGKALAEIVERRWWKTRIVFMSGFSEASVTQQGRLEAGVLLLSKPFRKADLARIVRHALDGSSAETRSKLAPG
jgi:PAS domain S-box-containing protein